MKFEAYSLSLRNEKNKPAQFRTCTGLNKLKAKNYF